MLFRSPKRSRDKPRGGGHDALPQRNLVLSQSSVREELRGPGPLGVPEVWTLPAAAGSAGVPPSPGSLGCTGKLGLQRPSPVPRVVGESSHLVLGGQAGHGGGPGLAFHGEVVLTVGVAVSAHLSHLHRLQGRWRGRVSPGAAWPGDPGVEGRAGLGAKGTVGSWRYLRVGLAIGHVGGGAPLRAPCARLLEHLLGPLGHPGRALFHATFVSHPGWGDRKSVV